MERDAILGHGISAFTNESYMLRSDGTSFNVCKGCGTIPIENPKIGIFICPLCTGPVSFIGSGASDMELIPPTRKTMVAPVTIEMPYAFKLLCQELETYMNIGMRIMTEKDLLRLTGVSKDDLPELTEEDMEKDTGEKIVLKERILPESNAPEWRQEDETIKPSDELLAKLGVPPSVVPAVTRESDVILEGKDTTGQGTLDIAKAITKLQSEQQGASETVPGSLVQTPAGKIFQPNPTTVTVLPKAIQITGPGEEIAGTEYEEIGEPVAQAKPEVTATNVIPQVLPQVGPMIQQQGGYYMMPQMAQQQYQQLNMGPGPAVYAQQQQMPPAHIFNAGIGAGIPPTFAIDTSQQTMGGFISQSIGPDARRSNITLKRNRVLSQASGSSEQQASSEPSMRVNVVKGS
jgi:hypothetical protein